MGANMNLRKPYAKCKAKGYEDLKEFFFEEKEITFSKVDAPEEIKNEVTSEKTDVSRVWLLFASHDKCVWECLQVAQSKKDIKREIIDDIDFLFSEFNPKSKNISYSNSCFYERVCPGTAKEKYRKLLYSKIGSEYQYFKICFLNVDKYLGIKSDCNVNTTDEQRIIQICKNQYAEAKIAYQTLAVYWRSYPSGIDGQTISYIVEHASEFE